jgi:hypothetical protein
LNADPDPDPATQINADPDPKPCNWDQFHAVVFNFSLLRRIAGDAAYFVDDICLSGDGESDVSDEEESESNDDSSQSGEEEGESSEDDEVELDIYSQCFRSGPDWIRIQSGQWIWSRIRIRNPDPDPGGQNDPQK